MIGTFRKYLKLKQKSRYILKIYGTIYSISEIPINLDFKSNKTLSFTNMRNRTNRTISSRRKVSLHYLSYNYTKLSNTEMEGVVEELGW